jgi:uncharacterized protein (TIGR02246 family)
MSADSLPDAAGEIASPIQAGWNAGDGGAFAAAFEEDADFVNVRGDLLKGRVAIARGHDGIFAGIYSDSRVAYAVRQCRAFGPDLGLVHLDARLEVPARPIAGTHHALLSLLLRAHGGAWRIAALHNTLVSEPGGR